MRIPRSTLPNTLTVASIACGTFSIVLSAEGDLMWAGLFIFVATILDFLDGMLARMLKATSAMGKELDSLADMVSFGVAPSILLYNHALFYGENWYNLLSLAIAVFAGIRLARFNTDPDQRIDFKGLPTPSVGILTASIPYILEYDNLGIGKILGSSGFLILFPVMCSFLMISNIPLLSFKFQTLQFDKNRYRYALITLSIGFLALFQFSGIPMVIITYILLSLIRKFAT